jgi:dTDP-4-amino-4,6-dideoxy-D-galactose acyltransferase
MTSKSKKTTPVYQYLDWDSNFFGCRIARVIPHKLDPKTVTTTLRWCKDSQIDCLYFLADAEDDTTIRLAEKHKFHCVDIRITFERRLKDIGNEGDDFTGNIRPSKAEDIIPLRDIARFSYRDTRFYSDTKFPTQLADALYETWIEKSCNGYADVVLVAEDDGKAVGYISCHRLDETQGQIGLVGVHSDWRGKRIGQVLVNQSLQWFAGRGMTHVSVVTQGRNIPAQRLYERCGFLSSTLQIWYHRWFHE